MRSGTILEGSKLPISYFFITLHLLIEKGNGLTIEFLQEQTCHKYYEPLYDFLKKIRTYLKAHEEEYTFITFLEVVNEYFLNKPIE
ncbi:MAG TPA: hypothetical protein VF691_09435 [Cytophagaceae bacterium]